LIKHRCMNYLGTWGAYGPAAREAGCKGRRLGPASAGIGGASTAALKVQLV
jgi:hypothetical protein